MAKQAFVLDLKTKIDIEKASKEIEYLAPPKKIAMFNTTDANFNGTVVRLFENGWIRVYVTVESKGYGEAMFKATESLTYLRRIISDLKSKTGVEIDADTVLAGIKPISEELALHEILLMDIDSVRPTYKKEMNSTFFRILHHHTLVEYLGAGTANKILYNTGEEVGRAFGGIYASEDLQGFLEELKNFMHREKIAKITTESSDSVITVKSEESMTSAGIPNVGRPICHFERGFIAGALARHLGKTVTSKETKCWGLGDTFCEFIIRPEE